LGNEFIIGAFMDIRDTVSRGNRALYDSFKNTGMNMIVQYAGAVNRQYLTNPELNAKVIAENDDGPSDYITYYSTGFYSKWESEEDQTDILKIGVKHKYGSIARWNNNNCWSTKGIIGAKNSIVYGPHYSQEKKYKRGYQPWSWYSQPVEYTARFRLALENNWGVGGNESVCQIKVVHRYSKKISGCFYTQIDTTLLQRTLTVADFNQDGSFKDFKFDSTYMYDSRFYLQRGVRGQMPLQENDCPAYLDIFAGNGIQFCVDWLRSDTLCTLYIDYAEVYDNDGWHNFTGDSLSVARATQNIENYLLGYSDWPNLVYWYGHDEPSAIDAIVPMKTIDSLVKFYSGKRVVTALTVASPPYWDPNYNGEYFHRRYILAVKPDTVIIDYFPFIAGHNVETTLEHLRAALQEIHSCSPNFWYVGQGFGEIDPPLNKFRTPDSTELKASVILSLAHGVKGILFWRYESGGGYSCIVTAAPNFGATPLSEMIKNNLAPRLKGKLGSTLLGLSYTGNFIQHRYFIPTQSPLPPPHTHEYLTVGIERTPAQEPLNMNWHVGFLEDSLSSADNKYFFLVNLLTHRTDSILVKATPPVTGYTNYRFRNVEGIFDTTFITQIIKDLVHPAGEGYLYQVAPVVKYGGKLIANETISSPTILNEDMTIENGATLFVNSTYTANANLTIKNGGKIIGGSNGQIAFTDGKRLIIEGSAQVNATTNNPLILFYEPTTSYGIEVKQGASLDISYCKIMEAEVGLITEPYFNSVKIENVNFEDCFGGAIALIGPYSIDAGITPIVKNCKIINGNFGVSAANLSELVIQQDSITNCGIGISLSQVPAAYIIGNNITSTELNFAGIFMHSSNGNIRGNFIQGNTDGIFLASSSPDIGANTIINNSEHGIYIGSGSVPNLVAYYAGEDPYPYTISGYNTIMENGNNSYGTMNGDGSEIYLNYSDIQLSQGCNIIAYDRTSTPELSTILLMNGYLQDEQPIYADGNSWGTIEPSEERFGNLPVNCTPYNIHPCPLPNTPCNELQVETSRGEIIDHIIPRNCDTEPISALAQSYAEANYLYSTGEVADARIIYQQISHGQYTPQEKLYAYNKLYTIGNLIDTTNNYFSNLQTTFTNLAQTVSDSTLMDVFTQNAILCKVSKGEYVSAINDFDNIIQQNPQSEEAVFAEMDILTTALLMDTTGGQLGKVAGGKYFIKGSADYLSKMSEVIKKNFGKAGKAKEKIIPTEYSLSQNYPNPFNPTTKIKYQLPYAAQVSLRIYDILGREITTLVNEEKQSGYYEVNFDAQTLSSGCYFYRIITKDFVKTMKMMVVK
jgi:parallel beta-helix repeat protein